MSFIQIINLIASIITILGIGGFLQWRFFSNKNNNYSSDINLVNRKERKQKEEQKRLKKIENETKRRIEQRLKQIEEEAGRKRTEGSDFSFFIYIMPIFGVIGISQSNGIIIGVILGLFSGFIIGSLYDSVIRGIINFFKK